MSMFRRPWFRHYRRRRLYLPTLPAVSGNSAITEGADALAASGTIEVNGSSGINEGADVLAAAGGIEVNGSSAISEGADTCSASGTITSGVTGSAAISEQADTMSATGSIEVNGTAAITESPDVLAGTNVVADTRQSTGVSSLVQKPARKRPPTVVEVFEQRKQRKPKPAKVKEPERQPVVEKPAALLTPQPFKPELERELIERLRYEDQQYKAEQLALQKQLLEKALAAANDDDIVEALLLYMTTL